MFFLWSWCISSNIHIKEKLPEIIKENCTDFFFKVLDHVVTSFFISTPLVGQVRILRPRKPTEVSVEVGLNICAEGTR